MNYYTVTGYSADTEIDTQKNLNLNGLIEILRSLDLYSIFEHKETGQIVKLNKLVITYQED